MWTDANNNPAINPAVLSTLSPFLHHPSWSHTTTSTSSTNHTHSPLLPHFPPPSSKTSSTPSSNFAFLPLTSAQPKHRPPTPITTNSDTFRLLTTPPPPPSTLSPSLPGSVFPGRAVCVDTFFQDWWSKTVERSISKTIKALVWNAEYLILFTVLNSWTFGVGGD